MTPMTETPKEIADKILESCKSERLAEIRAILQRGKWVADARRVVPNFDRWVRANFGAMKILRKHPFAPSRRYLYYCLQVYKTFGPKGRFETDPETLLQFDTTALFDLSDCWEIQKNKKEPLAPNAVLEALALARAGKYLTRPFVRELIEKHRRR